MVRTKEEFKNIYKEQIKGMEKEKALEHLQSIKFMIDMRDRWDEEDNNAWDAVTELIIEMKGDLK